MANDRKRVESAVNRLIEWSCQKVEEDCVKRDVPLAQLLAQIIHVLGHTPDIGALLTLPGLAKAVLIDAYIQKDPAILERLEADLDKSDAAEQARLRN